MHTLPRIAAALLPVATAAGCSGPPAVALQPDDEGYIRFTDATGGREFEHRLRDFNNLPSTDFDTVTRVLDTARRRVAERPEQRGP